MDLNDIAIRNIHDVDYSCFSNGISTSEAINLMQNASLSEKKTKHYEIKIYYYI